MWYSICFYDFFQCLLYHAFYICFITAAHFGGMFIIKESRGINYTTLSRDADEALLKLLNLCRDTYMGSIY